MAATTGGADASHDSCLPVHSLFSVFAATESNLQASWLAIKRQHVTLRIIRLASASLWPCLSKRNALFQMATHWVARGSRIS